MPGTLRFLLPLFVLVATFSWSQEESPDVSSADQSGAEETRSAAADDASPDAETEDDDLDEQVYEEDDDDFVPTQEIPADEPIPFPSNI